MIHSETAKKLFIKWIDEKPQWIDRLWFNDIAGVGIIDSFPHFNPKVGNHTTIEYLTSEEIQLGLDGKLTKKMIDDRIIKSRT